MTAGDIPGILGDCELMVLGVKEMGAIQEYHAEVSSHGSDEVGV